MIERGEAVEEFMVPLRGLNLRGLKSNVSNISLSITDFTTLHIIIIIITMVFNRF